MYDYVWPLLISGGIDTVIMVGISAIFTLLIGLPLAVILVITDQQGIYPKPKLNAVLAAIVNITRSIPFLILMVALIPLTRLLVGSSYGVWAAIVPLSFAAIPFFARIAEVSLRDVDAGLIEAAQAMGCSRQQIIRHVLLPESLSAIVAGYTVTLITMINSSAVAGAIGAGGLGDIAYRYGFQRFDMVVMLAVIVVLVALVMLIQKLGDHFALQLDKKRL
ncbi:methionine ABC transporter permease [Acinetobacter larvae]|uniref:ABC transporter permease n=1 Tax=Acinetobacter larvae TaxID=1789224 RepID=A0A1B2LYI2_9GAMM|nr:methionine ABC transporter permease [Acinetobacter larvae]AOA57939.1 ABC transporter permease [Acinetobacter larvae]